jgi:RNase P protein component
MINRLSGVGEFDQLRGGRRRRHAGLWCVFVPDPSLDEFRVGFATPRALGPAVIRNRIRRRLRAALRHVDSQSPLAPGRALFGGTSDIASMPWLQLVDAVQVVTGAGASVGGRR